MTPAMKALYELALIAYVTASPFGFLWFHKVVLKQEWDWDLADQVTVRLYVISNIIAGYMAYSLQEWRC